jgi:hypothetical protein
MPNNTPRTVGEIDAFVNLLLAACDDAKINTALERLLALPDEKRKLLVHNWVSDLLIKGAPRDFVQAIACLSDDAIAERAYEVIFNCRR